MASLFDTPESGPQTSTVPAENPYLKGPHPYEAGPPAGAVSLFGDMGLAPDPMTSRPSLFDAPADQLVEGSTMPLQQTQIEAGIDTGQAMLWEGANQLLQATGFSGTDAQEYAEEAAKKNMAAASLTPVNGLWDEVQRGFGTLGAAALPVAVGGAIGTVIGAPLAAATGAVTAAGMNLGELSMAAKELDPEFIASASDFGLAGALGVAELLPAARIAKGLMFAKPKMAAEAFTGLAGKVGKVAGETAAVAATEGLGDAAIGFKAYQTTGTELTEEAVAGIIDNAITEATVGALIAGPFSAVGVGVQGIADAIPDRVQTVTDENGNVVDVVYDAPTDDSLASPSMWKTGVATAFGKSTDVINTKLKDNSAWQGLRRKLVQNKDDRVQMVANGEENVIAQDVLEQVKKGEINDGVQELFNVSDEDANAAMRLKAEGLKEAPTPEQQQALDAIWKQDENVRRLAGDLVGFKERGETYVPFTPDSNKIRENYNDFIKGAEQDLIAQGMTPEQVQGIMENQVIPYAEQIKEYGRFVPADASSNAMGEILNRKFAELSQSTTVEGRIKKAKSINRTIKTELGAVVNKANALEQSRALGALTDKFLLDWNSMSGKAKNLYEFHAAKSGERLAHVDHWGENNEKYWAQVADVITEEYGRGREVDADTFRDFTQLINIAQKLPKHRVSVKAKSAMSLIRSFQNITKLPLAIIPSTAEMFFVMNEFGVGNTLSTFGKGIKYEMQRKIRHKKPPAEYSRLVDGLSLSLREATGIVADRMSGEAGQGEMLSKAAEGGRKWENRMFSFLGLAPFTQMLRITGAIEAERSIIQAIRDITSGDKYKQNVATRKLMEAGLEPGAALKWQQEGGSFESAYYKENVRPAALALSEDVVVHPTPLKKPMWHSDERLMLVAHLKSFATVFTNTTMSNWYTNIFRGALSGQGATVAERVAFANKLFPYLAAFVGSQILLAGLREWIRTGDTENWDDKTFWEHMMAGISYLGGAGMALESVHGTSYGRSFVDSIIGPTAGTATTGAKVAAKAMEDPEGAMEQLIKGISGSLKGLPAGGYIDSLLKEALGVE